MQAVQITRRGKSTFPNSPVTFEDKLGGMELRSATIDTLQVNVGKLCNQACKHCHVDASPIRTEIMSRATIDACLKVLRKYKIPTLDITGGAPEMIPDFRYFVMEAGKTGVRIIVRHNLTVMFEENQTDLPEFFAENTVEVVSSLPYFLQTQTDAQRGKGVFDKSIEALKKLNAAGYGIDGNLVLNLVYNPVGAFLPPAQEAIEADFKRELKTRYGIVFNNLFTVTNMPIARYLDWLQRSNNEESYMQKLVNAFNPATINGLMCRNLVSIDWTGKLYDCDFNQMLDLGVKDSAPQKITEFDPGRLAQRRIVTGSHCFGCTAGAGSTCGGVVVSN
ncbi:MAG: arsenosugar biosynthesis radical SAM protein ArsS [Acidobacteria bacterium]|nr:arsenosugar biosynthesis radical SAM protein ArsS [Acidobacteriota bacterium]MCA1638800.1 arsenosugar biosynthesis radical SAM protein ArsS [Acidobacteriota bacterium]